MRLLLIGRGPLCRHDACPIQANRPPELEGREGGAEPRVSDREDAGSPPRPARSGVSLIGSKRANAGSSAQTIAGRASALCSRVRPLLLGRRRLCLSQKNRTTRQSPKPAPWSDPPAIRKRPIAVLNFLGVLSSDQEGRNERTDDLSRNRVPPRATPVAIRCTISSTEPATWTYRQTTRSYSSR